MFFISLVKIAHVKKRKQIKKASHLMNMIFFVILKDKNNLCK